MSEMHVVMCYWHYDTADAVKVFKHKEAAEAEAARLNTEVYPLHSYSYGVETVPYVTAAA